MKKNFLLLLFFVLVISCQNTKNSDKIDETISTVIENDLEEEVLMNPLQITKSEKELYKGLEKKTPLTEDQLLAVIPESLNGNQKFGEHAAMKSNQIAQGMYGTAQSNYSFWIQDGAGSLAIVRNFFDSLKFKNQGPADTEYVYTEHDGYKTIAFLQPKIKQNKISFIYNNRFRISLRGPDSADALWSYIDFENLKKLDQYN